MLQQVMTAPGKVEFREVPIPQLKAGEVLVKIMDDPEQRADFLDFCYRYDASPYVCGMGKDNLLAVGEL